jgi:hypothetical protein
MILSPSKIGCRRKLRKFTNGTNRMTKVTHEETNLLEIPINLFEKTLSGGVVFVCMRKTSMSESK